jgi:hypothetical protein
MLRLALEPRGSGKTAVLLFDQELAQRDAVPEWPAGRVCPVDCGRNRRLPIYPLEAVWNPCFAAAH